MSKYIQIVLISIFCASSQAEDRETWQGPISIQDARQLGAAVEAVEDFVIFRGKRMGFIHYKMSFDNFADCAPKKVVAQAFSEGASLLNARLGVNDGTYDFSVNIDRPEKSRLLIFCKSGDVAGYSVVFN